MAKPPVAPEKTKEVAIVENSLPADYNLDSLVADAEEHNPRMDTGDIALPYIVVLQTNSPQVNPAKAQFIEGAQAGMLYNTVMDVVFNGRTEGMAVIPCAYERKFVEWVHRDQGGGWVAEHSIESDIMNHTRPDDKGKPRLPNGNVVVETAYHYILFKDPDTEAWGQGIMAMSSTFLKKNRKWNNMITTSKIPGTDKQAPRFLYAYQLTSVVETKGENSWFVPELKKIESPISLSLYNNAKAYAALVNQGKINRAPPPESGADQIDPETGEVMEKAKEVM